MCFRIDFIGFFPDDVDEESVENLAETELDERLGKSSSMSS